jgi:hypothetical protein
MISTIHSATKVEYHTAEGESTAFLDDNKMSEILSKEEVRVGTKEVIISCSAIFPLPDRNEERKKKPRIYHFEACVGKLDTVVSMEDYASSI